MSVRHVYRGSKIESLQLAQIQSSVSGFSGKVLNIKKVNVAAVMVCMGAAVRFTTIGIQVRFIAKHVEHFPAISVRQCFA